jgi:hypothetical protein
MYEISAHEVVHHLLMDHAATAAIHSMILMLVNDGANECQKMHQGVYHDVERLNVGKAS